MKLTQTTTYPVNQLNLWEQILKPESLNYISNPLMKFIYNSPLPKKWNVGKYATKLKIFGLIPFGEHIISIEFPPISDSRLILRDNGYGRFIKKWDHWIYLSKVNDTTTLYEDEVNIHAGLITPFVWAFANIFYWHRQKRWTKLIKNSFKEIM